jgi:hypothetical protein
MNEKAAPKQTVKLLVAWWPGEHDTLMSGLPTLATAILYSDAVTVLCPESDDFLEMRDYSDFSAAGGPPVDTLTLDQQQPLPDRGGFGPVFPDVWDELRAAYEEAGRSALASGDTAAAGHALACLDVIEDGDTSRLGRDPELRPLVSSYEIRNAAGRFDVWDDVHAALLAGYLSAMAAETHTYAILDDPTGRLRGSVTSSSWDQFMKTRGREAGLSAHVLRQLPSPKRDSWDAIAAAREGLDEPLSRFQTALAKLATTGDTDPLSKEFDAYAETAWRTEILPALDELEALVREAGLREVFFRDVLGDLKTYAGPAVGLAAALGGDLPALVSGMAGATPVVGSAYAKVRARRQRMASHEYFFYQQVATRLA